VLSEHLLRRTCLLTEFGALPIPILRLALSSLEKQGKARVFEGSESGDDMAGVKFA
jgi:hypothetical protein